LLRLRLLALLLLVVAVTMRFAFQKTQRSCEQAQSAAERLNQTTVAKEF